MGSKISINRYFKRKNSLGPSYFAQLDETRAPNVKQYLRGVRNYFILSHLIKVTR